MGRESRRKLLEAFGARPHPGRVVVGYPVGGSVTLPFHVSIIRLLMYELGKPDRKRLLAKVTHTKGLYVADNRQLLAEKFLPATNADWLLQIDTDIEFPRELLETMIGLADGREILAASVPLGEYPSCAFMRDTTPGIWRGLSGVPTRPVEVDGIATACCLVHRRVFEAIADRHGQCWFHHIYLPKAGEADELAPGRGFKFVSQGEDLAFSVRAAEAGFRLWAVHVPGLRHHKTRGLSHDDERAFALASEDAAVGEMVEEG